MIKDQFIGQDSELARSLVQDQQRLLEKHVVIKRLSTTSGGDYAKGVAPTKVFVLIEASMRIRQMTGKDVLNGGGIYQVGDLEADSFIPIFGADNRGGTNVDQMLMDGQTYQLVGTTNAVPMGAGTLMYQSHWRRQS